MSNAKRDFSSCPNCHKKYHGCDRCQTDGVCDCCPCECEYVDPSPAATKSMRQYDAAQERAELHSDSHEE